MERVEVAPKIHVDVGETKEQVVFGGQRATSFVKKVVAGEVIDGKKYHFNDEFIMAIYNRVAMAPGIHGFLRQTNSTTVGGEPVSRYEELEWKLRLYGRWLEEQMITLKNNPEDIVMALEISAAAHYGLTMPEFHPFDNGNGRTARALVNAILMSQSYELTAHHLAIPPLPILRPEPDGSKYIQALRIVDKTKTLNPLMVFLAQQWIQSLDDRLDKINKNIKNPRLADQLLITKLENRRKLLTEFISSTSKNGKNEENHRKYVVPDYFERKYIKVSNDEAI